MMFNILKTLLILICANKINSVEQSKFLKRSDQYKDNYNTENNDIETTQTKAELILRYGDEKNNLRNDNIHKWFNDQWQLLLNNEKSFFSDLFQDQNDWSATHIKNANNLSIKTDDKLFTDSTAQAGHKYFAMAKKIASRIIPIIKKEDEFKDSFVFYRAIPFSAAFLADLTYKIAQFLEDKKLNVWRSFQNPIDKMKDFENTDVEMRKNNKLDATKISYFSTSLATRSKVSDAALKVFFANNSLSYKEDIDSIQSTLSKLCEIFDNNDINIQCPINNKSIKNHINDFAQQFGRRLDQLFIKKDVVDKIAWLSLAGVSSGLIVPSFLCKDSKCKVIPISELLSHIKKLDIENIKLCFPIESRNKCFDEINGKNQIGGIDYKALIENSNKEYGQGEIFDAKDYTDCKMCKINYKYFPFMQKTLKEIFEANDGIIWQCVINYTNPIFVDPKNVYMKKYYLNDNFDNLKDEKEKYKDFLNTIVEAFRTHFNTLDDNKKQNIRNKFITYFKEKI